MTIERVVAERIGSVVGGAIGRGIVDAADAGAADEGSRPSAQSATRRVLALGLLLSVAVLVLAVAATRSDGGAQADTGRS